MEKKPKSGGLIGLIVVAIIVILMMMGVGTENSYSKAGREFDTWTRTDPKTWTSTEKQYYNDFRKWADKN